MGQDYSFSSKLMINKELNIRLDL